MSWSRAGLLAIIPWLFLVAAISGLEIWQDTLRDRGWPEIVWMIGNFAPMLYLLCLVALRFSIPDQGQAGQAATRAGVDPSPGSWFPGLPGWTKLVFLLAALPSWLFFFYAKATGRHDGPATDAALGLCFVVILMFIASDNLSRVAPGDGGDPK